jgi:hypothetical protein
MKATKLRRLSVWTWKKFCSLARLKSFWASRYRLSIWVRINREFLDALQHGLDN